QDLVMTVYLKSVFPPWLFTVIAVVLLAAAMSTLDGLLVSLSTITANDLVLNLLPAHTSEAERLRLAMLAGRAVLVVIAVAAFLINLSPPRLLGIFGQVGVYGLAAALTPALLLGVLKARPPLGLAVSLSVAGATVHFGLYFFGARLWPEAPVNLGNPGLTAALAALVTVPPAIFVGSRGRRPADSAPV
ncbi:MAG: hypothetical protein AAGF46_03090, partial [Pseudomonadota bacterium]